jgi:hypothetical protein
VIGATIGLAAPAWGASAALDIQCPKLDPGDFAALEATARAELSGAGGWDLAVGVACDDAGTGLRVRSEGGPPVEGSVRGSLADGASLDEVLAALRWLINQARLAARDARPLDPEDIPPPDPPRILVKSPRRPDYRFALVTGFDGEMWSAPLGPAVGPRAGVRVARNDEWTMELDGGFLSGLQSSSGFAASSVQGTFRVDFPLPYRFRIGFGANARLVIAAAGSDAQPGQLKGSTLGACLLARYTLRVDRFELSVGPEAELFGRPVVILAQGAEVFRLPTLTAGLSVEAVAEIGE